MKCENCGNILYSDAIYCPLCGSNNLKPINNNNQSYNSQNINNNTRDYYGNNMNNYNIQSNYNTQSNYNNTSTNQNNYSNTTNSVDKSKKNIIYSISLFILSIIILIIGIYSSTHQIKKYKVLNETDFNKIMSNFNYKVTDLSKTYANQKYIDKYYTASLSNKSIIYVLINDTTKGNNLYNSIKKNITNYATSEEDIIINVDNNNIKKYAINNNKKYAVLVKVDNMIIYTITETKYMNEIDNIFKSLGYKTTDFKGNILYFIISISIILVLYLISLYRLFIKLGEKGIYSIVPLYNIYILSKKILGNGIFFIGFLIPIVNTIMIIYLNYKLGRMFNKNIYFILGLIILNPIFLIILSLDNSSYIGIKKFN